MGQERSQERQRWKAMKRVDGPKMQEQTRLNKAVSGVVIFVFLSNASYDVSRYLESTTATFQSNMEFDEGC